jgi:metal-responsive CopG/Arc/MetJ family transcriptional regulator
MKTAISLPDDVFEAAEDLAAKLGVSRSQLYSRALAAFVAQHQRSDVTERLNAIYDDTEARLDPLLEDLQSRSVGDDDW